MPGVFHNPPVAGPIQIEEQAAELTTSVTLVLWVWMPLTPWMVSG